MTGRDISADTFQSVLKEIGTRHINFKFRNDDLFVLWFLRSYVTDSEERAAEAIAGGARDKGIDALLIDDRNKTVVVVQAKYRKGLGEKAEKRADVISLVEIAERLSVEDEGTLTGFLESTDVIVAKRLKDARKRIMSDRYKIWLCFVTLGKVSASIRADAESLAKHLDPDTLFEVIDADGAKVRMQNYLDGDAPPIPALDLEMEDRPGVRVNGVADRCDDGNGIESWVFSMRGDRVAALFDRFDTRLFAKNIRGFLGKLTPVNRAMVKTLREEPDRFFYYNNGLTILCEYAKKETQGGRDVLHVRNPQVINGQQTTRTLAEHPNLAQKASVLVKVITLSKPHESAEFEALVTQIVQGTNWQNRISRSDLVSNDRIQVELERGLRKLQYAYIRKQQTKSEARRSVGSKQYFFIKKHDLAQAVAACELDPVVARTSRERLFEPEYYRRVFPSSDPLYYLPRYWLLRRVANYVSGTGQRRETRWLILHFVWSRIRHAVKSTANARAFAEQCRYADRDLVVPLSFAIERVFKTVLKFYKANSGKGLESIDFPTFFKSKRASAGEFEKFWDDTNADGRAFEKHLGKVIAVIGR